ncbi:carbohydrate ABC transporter permease [Streptomyces sp. NPDC047070]|uniref:carbohydrate ABC transporter permease n=1 Tax=Streptomyces sp. NPDC047070 TaxID=3154923 RepID=UPI00345169A9
MWRLGRPALVLLLAALAVGVPLWLVAVTSAKPQAEAVRPNLDLPRRWQPAGNYEDAVGQGEMLRGFLNSPLEEAARMDGAKPLRIFLRIVLPLLRPVIATATIMVTLYAWSDVFYAFFVLGGGERSTLPLNLYKVAGAQLYLNNWHLVFAYVVVMSLPMVAIFLVAQRSIVSGITSGAVK